MVQENDRSLYGKPSPSPLPSAPSVTNHHQQQQQYGLASHQQQRRPRQTPPQFQPQPLEPPPLPPALSVGFTVVACPWWTVLEGNLKYPRALEPFYVSLVNIHFVLLVIRCTTCNHDHHVYGNIMLEKICAWSPTHVWLNQTEPLEKIFYRYWN